MRMMPSALMSAAMFMGMVGVAQVPDRVEIYSSGGGSALLAAPVTNEPYSARQVTEKTRVLADGAKQQWHESHFVARDSQGRVRLEERIRGGEDGKPEVKKVYVKDPVAHTLTTWLEGCGCAKVAKVSKLPETETVPVTCGGCSVNAGPSAIAVETAQDLGSNVVDNVAVKGTLYTIQISPKDSHADRPLSKTHEMWVSDEMKLVMKQTWEDPRNGEKVVELRDFKGGEPPAELFRVPAGYTVQTKLENLKQMVAKLEAAQQ
jgi:hypothetical protein